MKDTIEVIKSIASSPVPYVNTGIFLGMTEADWDLALKVLLGLASVIWTITKAYVEIKKVWNKKDTTDL